MRMAEGKALGVLILSLLFYSGSVALPQFSSPVNATEEIGNFSSPISSFSQLYVWTYTNWSTCDGSCGEGIQRRTATCVVGNDSATAYSLGTAVDDTFCDSSLKETLELKCGVESCQASWHSSEWSKCVPSNGMVRIRSVNCRLSVPNGTVTSYSNGSVTSYSNGTVTSYSNGSVTSPSNDLVTSSLSNCSMADRPEIFQLCEDEQVAWLAGPWSKCDSSCGVGQQLRDLWCTEAWNLDKGSLVVLPDHLCSALERPASVQHCYLGSCLGADWVVSEWFGCRNSCEQTFETRIVMCIGRDGRRHLDAICDSSKQPAAKRVCDRVNCEQETRPKWFSSDWSACSVTCGRGKQFRSVFCAVEGGEETFHLLYDLSCLHLEKMKEERDCISEDCHALWITSSFGKCSVSCGSGKRRRYVWCLLEGSLVDRSLCGNRSASNDVEDCNSPPCTESEMPDCLALEFGCCDDGVTPADGPDMAGCPQHDDAVPLGLCQNSEFGCCPDHLTPAQGPFAEGCFKEECQESEFGCCSDGYTAASDADGRGCSQMTICNGLDCESNGSASVGVGPDDVTMDTFNDSMENDSVADAVLEGLYVTDTGSISSTMMTSLDHDYGSGDMTPGDVMTSGSISTDSCSASTHGCCPDGISPADGPEGAGCSLVTSSVKQKPELCTFPMDRGDCEEKHRSWFYNVTLDQCFPFTYTGCGGNDNRFAAEYQCNSACRSEHAVPQSLAICVLPPDYGPCNVPITKWHYNHDLGQCQPFTFGGCEGNDNKFDSRRECEAVCSILDICQLPVDIGDCSNFSMSYYFSRSAGECLPFSYGGCHGNANRFRTFRDCSIVCKQAYHLQVDLCQLQSDPGPCFWYTMVFFYNATLGTCQKFSWGGCGGNRNRFATMEKCLEYCALGHKVQSKLSPGNHSVCTLKSDPGPCKAFQPMWYFEPMEKACRRFLYGGCGGNANLFETLAECSNHCQSDFLETNLLPDSSATEIVVAPTPSSRFSSTVDQGSNCLLPRDPGPCIAYQLRWYFDQLEARCQQFHYGGCEGNGNNYNSAEECVKACHEFVIPSIPDKLTDICSAARDAGPCFADFLRYHWDAELEECRPFIYGGCQGNENNFVSQEDCYWTCGNDSSSLPQKKTVNVGRRRLYKPGDCYEFLLIGASCAQTIRWYFDIVSGDCLPFYYKGCNADGNNFHTHDDCISFCLKVTELCGIFQCELECADGHQRGPDGCLQCQCNDPCESFACKENFECHLDNSSCTDRLCHPKPVCKPQEQPEEKSGGCPIFSDNWTEIHGCKFECKRDADCSGSNKCCHTGCGKICVPLIPKEAPTIADSPELIEATLGNDVTIPCKARGAPLPQVSWFKDGNPLLADNNVASNNQLIALADGSLIIRNISKTDATSYTCRALNSVASVTRTYTVIVHVPARIIDVVPRNMTVHEGGTVSFRCLAEGDPEPVITWFRRGEPLKQTTEVKELQHQAPHGSVLVISDVVLDFHGTYECMASNGVGPSQKQSVMLEVLGTFFVNVTSNGTNFTTGMQANLLCNVTGAVGRDMKISWMKDGIGIPMSGNNHFHSSEENELVIRKLEVGDSGEYVCKVTRRDEEVEASVVILVTEEDDGVPEGCVDKPQLADCKLLLEARLCHHAHYSDFCCRSCFLAGQLSWQRLARKKGRGE